MIENGKLKLNLEAQVLKNKDDIIALQEENVAFNYIGMKVVGQVNTVDELPQPENYEVWPYEYGDAFAVGTIDPYAYYLWTRAFGAYLNDHWFKIGIFPGPSNVPGPKGEKGDTGPAPNLSIGSVTSTLSQPQVTIEGNSPNYILNFKLQKGDKGDPGTNGRNGTDGKNGKDGTNAILYTVKGVVDNINQLPDPATLPTDTAYILTADNSIRGIIVLNGVKTWYNYGSTSVGPAGPAGVGTTDLNSVQFPNGQHSITFDDVDGLSITATGNFSYDTATATPNMTIRVPLKAGAGITMDSDANSKFLEIKNADHDAVANKLDKVSNATTYIQVYGKGAGGGQTMINATSDTVGLIMLRDANKCASVGTPTQDTHITNKAYVDEADAKKLDKKVASLGQIKLYGVNGSTQNMYAAVAGSADPLTVVMRGADGTAVFEQGTSLKSAVILDTIEPVVITPTTPKDTNGTISEDQLNRLLQDSLSSVNTKPGIFMNNEYYTPMDREYEIGFLGYTHTGYENNRFTVKNIKINTSTKAWVLKTGYVCSLAYKHNIKLTKSPGSDSDPGYSICCQFDTNDSESYKSFEELWNAVGGTRGRTLASGVVVADGSSQPEIISGLTLTTKNTIAYDSFYLNPTGGGSVTDYQIMEMTGVAFRDTVSNNF